MISVHIYTTFWGTGNPRKLEIININFYFARPFLPKRRITETRTTYHGMKYFRDLINRTIGVDPYI